jgi:hypothetical protein
MQNISMEVRTTKHRTICLSGIPETIPGQPTLNSGVSCVPSTIDLRKARRLASKKRILVFCSECKRRKRLGGDVGTHCPRCISLRETQFNAYNCAEPHSDFGAINRPIKFGVSSLRFRRSTAFPQGSLKYQWSSSIIRPVWEIGHKYSSFETIFNAMPATLSHSIAGLLEAVAIRSQTRRNEARSEAKISRATLLLGNNSHFPSVFAVQARSGG